jgi:sarcosine oxidase
MTVNADVAVVGLGTIGSMALWRLAARGVTVHGYERFGIGHHRGAAGGQTRRFSTLSQRDLRGTPLALDALDLWRQLERDTGHDLLTLTGGLIFGPGDSPALLNAVASARANDLVHEVLGANELRARFPQHWVRDGDTGVIDELSGFIRPELSVVAAVQAAQDAGADVSTYTRVLGIEREGDLVVVRTDAGDRRHRAVVVAPGAWASQVVPIVGGNVVPRRVVQAWYVPRDTAAYQPNRFPVFERVGDVNAYGFPTVDGATVKVAFYTGGHPVVDDLEKVDLVVDVEKARELRSLVSQFLPGLNPDPVTLSVHIEGYTADSAPIVGPVPGLDGVYAACGFSGAGFKFATVMGDIVADQVVDGRTRRDVDSMLPGRAIVSFMA